VLQTQKLLLLTAKTFAPTPLKKRLLAMMLLKQTTMPHLQRITMLLQ
jgi:hypothetical protein